MAKISSNKMEKLIFAGDCILPTLRWVIGVLVPVKIIYLWPRKSGPLNVYIGSICPDACEIALTIASALELRLVRYLKINVVDIRTNEPLGLGLTAWKLRSWVIGIWAIHLSSLQPWCFNHLSKNSHLKSAIQGFSIFLSPQIQSALEGTLNVQACA